MTVYVEWADPATEVNAVLPGTHPAPVAPFTVEVDDAPEGDES